MKNKLLYALLICASAVPALSQAQGFIGNGTSNGIKAVNSSGTLTGVNVGIGVATPATGATLEVADPGGGLLGLRFDALPYVADTNILYYNPATGVVTYGPLPSGAVSSVDYNCGIGTVSVNGVASTYRAWLLSGSTTVDSTNYFGTYNNDDIRIATNNNSCILDPQKQKMLVGKDGSIGIATYDGTNLPTYPRNKLLVQNGGIIDPYAIISALSGGAITPNNLGMVVTSNDPSGINLGNVSIIQQNNAANSIGYTALIAGDNSSQNTGYNARIDGNGSATNTGINLNVGQSSSTSSQNVGITANVTGYKQY